MERRIGIPPDFKHHTDIVFAQADDPPFMWHRPAELLKIAELLRWGEGLRIGIIDTGYTPHKWLPEPEDVFNFTDSRTSDAVTSHGEHVFGIIGGLKGIGLLPRAKFWIVKGLGDNGSGQTNWLNNGIRKLADVGCHMINGSYGSNQGSSDDTAAQRYFYEKGGWLLHFAAGNAGYNGRQNSIGYPARDGNCSVDGSYDADGNRSSFSSGGPQLQVLGAGGAIVSTVPKDSMGVMSGTSMGTPDQLAKTGLLALARQAAGLPPLVGAKAWNDEYRRLLDNKLMRDGGTPGRDDYYGFGQFTTAAITEQIDKLVGA